MMRRSGIVIVIVTLCSVLQASMPVTLFAAGPRVLAESKQPDDVRLKPLKDLNGYFPFEPPASAAEWQERSDEIRRRILVATGLWPLPERTPLNPVMHGKVSRPGFTVEKVYFESFPNHFVTGLLFRPAAGDGPFPGVLCPHGHGGRMQDYGESQIKKLIELGQEKYEKSGRFPKLARCAQLARMGCVVLIFDMLGYADSVQISYELAHRFAKQRPELDSPDRWGLYSTQAELRMQSIFGIQAWNSVRALDFLAELPDVDSSRLGVTGGSGGGTQTIILGAIDERPVVSFPQGMVSTSMQGGCTCENAAILRIGTGNVELAALFAPRPMAMTGANDWTKEIATKGYPQLQQLYSMLGKPDNVLSRSYLEFPHNYNAVTRAMMYEWFNEHLKLGQRSPIVEEDYEPLTAEEATVWNSEHPRPDGGTEYEVDLLRRMDAASEQQRQSLIPSNGEEFARYRATIGSAVDTLIGRTFEQVGDIKRTKVFKEDKGSYWQFGDLLDHAGEQIPVVSFYPKDVEWNGRVTIWIDGAGKQALFSDDGALKPHVRELVESGTSVISADLIYQGEFLTDGQPLTETPAVANPREYAGYTFGYNDTVFAQRVHDILTVLKFVKSYSTKPQEVELVGVGGAGALVAAAAAVADGQIDQVAVDTGGFRFESLTSYRDPAFLPGIVKYGDLPALLALTAPARLLIAGEPARPPAETYKVYQAAGISSKLQTTLDQPDRLPVAIINWLSAP